MATAAERRSGEIRRLFKRELLSSETRTHDQVLEHYEVEIGLAERLRQASGEQRLELYARVYDELFRRVPHHQQLTQKESAPERAARAGGQMAFLGRFLQNTDHLIEVGAGDCALTLAAAQQCRWVTPIDVSKVVTQRADWPANVEFKQTNGLEIPVPAGSADVAFSDQLMEHLHPEDAQMQLNNIYEALAPGGRYVCVTPNRVAGPWDISMYFDEEARGLHLKEYRVQEIHGLFRQAGFARVAYYAGGRGFFIRVPRLLISAAERLLMALPYSVRSRLGTTLPVRGLLGIRAVAYKA